LIYSLHDFDLAKWEYIVLALKTKIHISRFEREKNPIIQNEMNALGKRVRNWWMLKTFA